MDPVLRLVLTVIGFVLAAIGLVIVYAAPRIVDKKGLAEKKVIDPKTLEHLPPESHDKYRRDSAILDVKLRGLLVAAPGFILIMIVFR